PDRKAFARLAYNELDWSGTGGGGGGSDPGDGGDNGGGGTGGSSITYVESQGDLLFIHIDNGDSVKAYPSIAQRWVAEANSFGSGGGGGSDPGDGDNGGGGNNPTPGVWTDPLDNQRC